jgi:hypothetical protein
MNSSSLNVVGYVHIPNAPKKHKCVCDECSSQLDDSFGDPRVKVQTFDSMDAKEPSSVRWVCEVCADELFGDHYPNSIFG